MLMFIQVRWLEDRREKIQSPPRNPPTPTQQYQLTPVQQDPPHRYRFRPHRHSTDSSDAPSSSSTSVLQTPVLASSATPGSFFTLTTQLSSSTASSTDPVAWKLPSVILGSC
ncbi:hypothetical protein M9H77_28177 [Catharanthus roseus]|uniref:Uncharacterized protein n=1 Tax=Catharanthus roseus TaxID=4058 RepID=A0ACC0AGT8_CATRO|nr:hypothetical protein M9H77_28177 [Catharanthus roseus]